MIGGAAGMVLGLAGQSPIVIGVIAPAALLLYVWRKHDEQRRPPHPRPARDLTHPDEQEHPWR